MTGTKEGARAGTRERDQRKDKMTDEQQQTTEEQGYAEGWRPNPGDRIAGTVVDIAATDGGYGVYPIVTLKTSGGEVAVHAFHTVLRRELARRRPSVGDDLEITYLGKQKAKGAQDRGYDGYRVRSSKDTVGYDWGRELADAGLADETTAAPPIDPAPVPTATQAAPGAQFGDDPPFTGDEPDF